MQIKPKVGLIGGFFQHAYSSTWWKHPKYFDYNKERLEDITFFIDSAIVPNINTKCSKKIAWLVEASSIIPQPYIDVLSHLNEVCDAYDLVISHDKRVYGCGHPKCIYLPPHGYWIENPKLYPKTKKVSMMSSNKRMCPGHDFRLGWVNKLQGKVDLYGNGFKHIPKKEEALCDYMYSVTIENSQYLTYWTEKILDCFVCGTIPIYHGSPDLGDYFNMDGVIVLDDNFNINDMNKDLYMSKKDAIVDNYERSLKYNVIEDIIWEKYFI